MYFFFPGEYSFIFIELSSGHNFDYNIIVENVQTTEKKPENPFPPVSMLNDFQKWVLGTLILGERGKIIET